MNFFVQSFLGGEMGDSLFLSNRNLFWSQILGERMGNFIISPPRGGWSVWYEQDHACSFFLHEV